MKLYKDHTKEPFSLLVNDTNLPSDNSRTCTKITFSQKIKTIDNKIEQNKAQYNLRRQNANNLALSSRNVGKYEFLG